MGRKKEHIKIYYGYGHTNDLVVYGHILKNVPADARHNSNNIFINIYQMLRMFFVKPIAKAKVRLNWEGQQLETTTEADGLFKFEWRSDHHVPAGWHKLTVSYIHHNGYVIFEKTGKVFVPHITQYAFISDVDDTIMISHSATVFRRLKELFFLNARTRSVFPDVGKHYKMLSENNTEPGTPNPFFYVSSSEWNLYDYLVEFFGYNNLPKGAFLLSQLKQWFQFFKTGKTKHELKVISIMRILHTFPSQQFVLLGDNSQRDPMIYQAICEKYPGKVHAVYIRNIKPENEPITKSILDTLTAKGVHTCLFVHSSEAIAHSVKIGLVAQERVH